MKGSRMITIICEKCGCETSKSCDGLCMTCFEKETSGNLND